MQHKSILLALAMALSICTAQSQDLGGFLKKKVEKGMEKISGKTNNKESSLSTTGTVDAVPIEWGGTMVNPAAKLMDVELIGVYGTKKTVNFGDVYVVLKINSKIVKDRIQLGAGDVAFDDSGNQYKTHYNNIHTEFTISEGVAVKCDFSEKEGHSFENVPITTETFQKIKIGYYLDYNSTNGTGVLEFNDVPIKWDVDEE